MPKYKVGDVAALFPNPPKPKTESGKKIQSLFEEFYNKPSKPSKKWKSQNQFEGKEKQVEDLVSKEKNEAMTETQPKKKKRKHQNSDIYDSVKNTDTQVAKKPKSEFTTEQAPFPRGKGERVEETEERLSRTLFVGNLPMSTTKKSVEKLFGPFGSLDSCRLRGAVPQKSTIPRKIAEIKHKYHAALQSRIAYVVLKQRKSAIEALSLSGVLIDGHHIVVDRASASGEKKLYDEKRSIFVGNLPFTIKDETLWSTFLPCGDIEAVRVIRDKETGAGKGFGYVSFQKIQGKENALALTKLEIEGRQLRIKCVEGGRKKKSNQPPSPWKGAMKRIAKKEKKDGNPNSRKTLRKLMKRGMQQHQKKKIAGIFKKLSRN